MIGGPLHLIVFGGQGSGKGTQAKRLVGRFGLVYLGTGELLRDLSEEPTPLGRRIKQSLGAGELVPDELIDQTVSLKLGGVPPSVGFVLDGYPRDAKQAALLRRSLNGLGRMIPKPIFINLVVPHDRLLERLRKRRRIEGRADDLAPAIRHRVELYAAKTEPLLAAVREWADVIDIDGNQSIEAVTDAIIKALEKHG